MDPARLKDINQGPGLGSPNELERLLGLFLVQQQTRALVVGAQEPRKEALLLLVPACDPISHHFNRLDGVGKRPESCLRMAERPVSAPGYHRRVPGNLWGIY